MPARRVRLGIVFGVTALSLALGWAQKSPCLGSWADGRQYTRLCYSDVVALYASDDRDRGLDEDRFPYVDGQNEYPVLTGMTMWVAALPATSYASFFLWTSVLLTGGALVTAAGLHHLVGGRALVFALAPTLVVYAFVNWDLIAVALATVATVAYLRERDAGAGLFLGLGAAAKLYPALLVIPFALGRIRQGRPAEARRLVLWSGGAWLAVNLPFALLGFDRWSEFFSFNSARPADWDSLWFMAARTRGPGAWLGVLGSDGVSGFTWNVGLLNALTAVTFVVVSVLVWRAADRRRPGFAAWTFGFPLLVLFLLTGKVYSPQYGLWLLPWFALALPDLRLFVAFELADVAVFVTRFQFFAGLEGVGDGLPFLAFEVAVILRAAVLVACLVAWVHRVPPRTAAAPAREPELEAA
ncbi:MAG: glycosyltransferase 87 family protein [Actinomycetota bacterium]|nr:glycosyltransferase 87 family protein [Actinomycetota bacterium]